MTHDKPQEIESVRRERGRGRELGKVSRCEGERAERERERLELAGRSSNNVRSRPLGWRFVERDEKVRRNKP